MQIPCAMCKITGPQGSNDSASEDLPLCSQCRKKYGDVLQYAYEQALYEHFKYHDRNSYSITLEALHPITELASKHASSIIPTDDLYLTGMFLRHLYRDDFVAYTQKELLYYLVTLQVKKH